MKALKIFGVIIISLLVFGVAIYFLVNRDSEDYLLNLAVQDRDYTETIFTSETELDNLDFQMINRSIIVKRKDVENVEITYFQSEKDFIEIKEISGNLVLSNKVKRNAFNIFSRVSAEKKLITITIPRNYAYDFKIKTINGDLLLEDLGVVKNIELGTINGSVTIKNIETTLNCKINSINGFILGENIISNNVHLETVNGEINLKNVVSNDIKLITTNGSIDVEVFGLFEEYRIDAHTTIGKVYYNDLVLANGIIHKEALKNIKISITTGNITMKFS